MVKIFEVVAYHGRRGNMRGFDTKHVGQNSTTFSEYKSTRYGSFFTDNPKFADIYGEVDKYDLRIQKTAKIDDALLTKFYDFAENLYDNTEIDRGLFMDIREIIQGNWNIWQLFEDDVGEIFVKWLKMNGYDSATYKEFLEDENGKELSSNTIVVFNPSKIEHKGQMEMDLYDSRRYN